MRVLLAPDKFKGSLSALEAAEAIARGWRRADPAVELDLAPIADGGEGFAQTLAAGDGKGEWTRVWVRDPLGREVEGRYYRMQNGTVVLDMSEASGLWRLRPAEYNPLKGSTYGTGELIRHAVRHGATRVLVGLGGSATNDGGLGIAAALGYRFLDSKGTELEAVPANLLKLDRVEKPADLRMPSIVGACDVGNPLLGERGATRVYGPQKGVCPEDLDFLESGLARLAEAARDLFGVDHRNHPGAGAAGGLGFGLLSFCGAQLRSGFELVAEALELRSRIEMSDLVVTGEGRLDGQTLEGKGPAGVAVLARACGKRVLAFAGSFGENAEAAFDLTVPTVDQAVTLEEAMKRGPEFLERAAWRTARILQRAKDL